MAKKVILTITLLFTSLILVSLISASYYYFGEFDHHAYNDDNYHNQDNYYSTFDYSRGYPNYEPWHYLHEYNNDHNYYNDCGNEYDCGHYQNDYYPNYDSDCYYRDGISNCNYYHYSREVPYTNVGFQTNVDNNCKLYGSHLFCE